MSKRTPKKKPIATRDQVSEALASDRLRLRRIALAQRSVRDLGHRVQRAARHLSTVRMETARALLADELEYGVYGREEVARLERRVEEALRLVDELTAQLQARNARPTVNAG